MANDRKLGPGGRGNLLDPSVPHDGSVDPVAVVAAISQAPIIPRWTPDTYFEAGQILRAAGGPGVFIVTVGHTSGTAPDAAKWTAYRNPDSTAPTAPTGLAAAKAGADVTVSWTASTDAVGVTGYEISIDGGAPIAVTTTSYTHVGGASANHSYAVTAVDAAGNSSAAASATYSSVPPTGSGTRAIVEGAFSAISAVPFNKAGQVFRVNVAVVIDRLTLDFAGAASGTIGIIQADTPADAVNAPFMASAGLSVAGASVVTVELDRWLLLEPNKDYYLTIRSGASPGGTNVRAHRDVITVAGFVGFMADEFLFTDGTATTWTTTFPGRGSSFSMAKAPETLAYQDAAPGVNINGGIGWNAFAAEFGVTEAMTVRALDLRWAQDLTDLTIKVGIASAPGADSTGIVWLGSGLVTNPQPGYVPFTLDAAVALEPGTIYHLCAVPTTWPDPATWGAGGVDHMAPNSAVRHKLVATSGVPGRVRYGAPGAAWSVADTSAAFRYRLRA